MAKVTTIFVADYGDQAPALFLYDHDESIDGKKMLNMAIRSYAELHPDLEMFGTDVFSDIPASFFASYGLMESTAPIRVEDFDCDEDYSHREGGDA